MSAAHAAAARLAYTVPRNVRGALPVYTDIRNGRTRRLINITHVQGDIHALRADLAASLYPPGSDAAARLHAALRPGRTDQLVLTGLPRDAVARISEWLRQRGF